MDIINALKTIQGYNVDILSEDKKVLGMLCDLVPVEKKDLRRIKTAYDSGAINQLKTHASNPEIAFVKACYTLREMDITPIVATEIVSLFVNALEWKLEDEGEKCYQNATTLYENRRYDEAVKFYEIAIKLGHTRAITGLGRCYNTGNGVPKDEKKAFELYQQAYELGCDSATTNLGRCYAFGMCGIERNIELGIALFKKAAENGFASAQRCLGHVYEKGIGVDRDLSKAFYWCECAANQGNTEAQHALGVYYFNGAGVPQDYEKALKYFESSAEGGFVKAWHALGLVYEKTGNLIEAVKCYKKALDLGVEESRTPYEQIIHQL